MRALTGLEERVSYVRFWLELLREVGGRRVGGFSEPVTATRSPQSSTGLLSLSSVLPPSRPHRGVGTKSDLRAVSSPVCLTCFQFSFCLFFSIHIHESLINVKKNKSISLCNYKALRSVRCCYLEIIYATV